MLFYSCVRQTTVYKDKPWGGSLKILKIYCIVLSTNNKLNYYFHDHDKYLLSADDVQLRRHSGP
jgi:hypothetical protein